MVPEAEFTSYYGKPVLNPPVWEARDIAGYFFLGGLAGGSSLLAAGADLTGRPELSRRREGRRAAPRSPLSLAALVHDLGRPARFLNMMRVFKVTSPMSVGTWLLSGYAPAAGVAAATALSGRLPRLGAAATAGAAVLGPAVAAYTAALISDTAVPAWHDGYPEMPFVFTGSAAMAAGGLGLLAAPAAESGPARNLALLGQVMETARLRADDAPHRDGGRAVPRRPRRRVHPGGSGPRRRRARRGRRCPVLPWCRRAGRAGSSPPSPAPPCSGASAATRWGSLPRRDGLRPRPEVHGRAAAAAAVQRPRVRTQAR